MDTKFNFKNAVENIVYVKSVATADMPADVQEQAGDLETLYAVHDADGQQLALVAEKHMAFALARDNDMAPVQVH